MNTVTLPKKLVQPGLKLITSSRDRVEEQIHLKIWLWLVSDVIATVTTSQKETDPESQVSTHLFNPRLDQWNEHFVWEKGGLVIRGKTSIGRATCDRLDLNDQEHNEGAIVKARRLWIHGGWHPPSDDAIES